VKFICDRLPKNRAQVLDAKDSFGNTPLHLAFINSNVEIIRQLVSMKSSLEVKNRDDMTPVDYGMTSDNSEIKRYLIDLEGWKQHHERKYR
jgi:ankyrin repeat protein